MNLRPAQEKILKYRGGRMAISAVPGSGKTFILSQLAAELLANQRLDVNAGQDILIVTYLNSSVETFRTRIRQRLNELGLPLQGFEVRTLHSLALEIVRSAFGGVTDPSQLPTVAEESQISVFLGRAVDAWIEANPLLWQNFLPEDSPQMRVRWRTVTEQTARTFVRTAKNNQYHADLIWSQLVQELEEKTGSGALNTTSLSEMEDLNASELPLLWMMANIYRRYQNILENLGAFDFDDLIWKAVELLEERPDMVIQLRQRWPFVLEDECQDSVPLQETLLNILTGPDGNWVRVGDPNQAITSTFTAADPRYFSAFIGRPDVMALPLPNSGRCAPKIYKTANMLVHWVCDNHPVPEVRRYAFRRLDILPTPIGDAQPNPPDSEAFIKIKVFTHREDDELPSVARQSISHSRDQPTHTIAILVPTNEIGHSIASILDAQNAAYDNLLKGSKREREIATVLQTLLGLLADPLSNRTLIGVHISLSELGHPVDLVTDSDPDHIKTLIRSVHRPELFLFPKDGEELATALPAGVADQAELRYLEYFRVFLRQIFELRSMPVDDLILTISDELFGSQPSESLGNQESDLAIAYQLANVVRQWRDLQPEWRLPELAEQLTNVAEGRRQLRLTNTSELGYEPEPGRITLATQHGAKGMEWDAVFLVGIDGFWLPGSLDAPFLGNHDFLGGDPSAEASAQLRYLMEGDAGSYPERDATESAHIDVICERLRLLYVGITRARRILNISRSRQTRRYRREYEAEPATIMGVLYQFLQEYVD